MFDSRDPFACAKIGSLVQGSTAAVTNGANRSGIFQEFRIGGSKTAFGNAIGTLESHAEFAMMLGTNPPENLYAFPGSSVRAKLFPVQQMSIRAVACEVVRDDCSALAVWWCLSDKKGNERVDFYGWSPSRAEKRLV